MPLPAPPLPDRWPGGVLDRSGAERDVDGLLDRARAASDTRVLVVHGDAAPVRDSRLTTVPVTSLSQVREWAFLGRAADGGVGRRYACSLAMTAAMSPLAVAA